MHFPVPRVPRQPAPGTAGAGLTDELASAAAGARRRAQRDGDHQVDTAHLLHSLLEADPAVRTAFDGRTQVARTLGYLVQRSIGYGLRWQVKAEDSGAFPALRGAGPAGWSPSVVAAMEDARHRAQRRGAARVGGFDLLAALAAGHDSRAVHVLQRAGVDTARLAGRAEALSQQVQQM
ncbi:Clp protease N-terminal domain-containing protein [Streptomyces sp. NPDC059176]|uniref:Clp protease N-terminal domain-containing protein n=1 Tax=unclassified Streptomyces TaxID=2593676 RepID=UPI0036BA56B7